MSWVPKIDTEFAGYRMVALIGHGGMSVVYRAEHLTLGRQVALKLLAPHLTEDESFRARFMRESRVAASLEHPNIIPIYEAGDEHDVFYIAMRFVEGSDLNSILKREGPLELDRAISILTQIAAALDVAHSKDLVHRDIKPANILIASGLGPEGSDHVYVSDFGVAKQTTDAALTRTGLFVGTADYAAPEQIEGKQLDGRADVYAMGCVLYQSLTGEMPYDRESEVAMMYAHLLEPPPSVAGRRSDLPPGIDEVIARAMAKSPDERYSSARDFAAALRSLKQGAPATAVATPSPEDEDGSATGSAERTGSGETVLATSPGVASAVESQARATQSPATAQAPQPTPATGEQTPGVPSGNGPRRSASRSRWVPIAAAGVVAALLSGGAVFLLTRGDSNSSNSRGSTPGTSQQPPASALGIMSLIAGPLARDCTLRSKPVAGALETAECVPPPNSPITNSPARWQISTYATAGAQKRAYDRIRTEHGIKPDSGRCGAGSWGGEGKWFHGPDKPGGRRLCYFDGNDAVIVWTHDRLGQATHRDSLGIARTDAGDHTDLFSWWRFWRHRVGKT